MLVWDGAMGTELNARGASAGQCLDELSLVQPALVLGVHRDYIAAGADIIETNSFRARRGAEAWRSRLMKLVSGRQSHPAPGGFELHFPADLFDHR